MNVSTYAIVNSKIQNCRFIVNGAIVIQNHAKYHDCMSKNSK